MECKTFSIWYLLDAPPKVLSPCLACLFSVIWYLRLHFLFLFYQRFLHFPLKNAQIHIFFSVLFALKHCSTCLLSWMFVYVLNILDRAGQSVRLCISTLQTSRMLVCIVPLLLLLLLFLILLQFRSIVLWSSLGLQGSIFQYRDFRRAM